MGIRYEWADDSKIIMNVYLEAPWTWAEYHQMTGIIMPMIRELGHPSSTVVDVAKMGSLPKDGNTLQILMNVEKIMPDNLFASVLVGAPYSITVFMNMLMKLRPRAKRTAMFTQTMEEAHAKVHARYQQLQASSKASLPEK
jgi:C4-dicarboxylate-specific signal transduction histidine kinase